MELDNIEVSWKVFAVLVAWALASLVWMGLIPSDAYTLSVAAFVGLLSVVVYAERDELEQQYWIFFVSRTERGKELVQDIVDRSSGGWRLMGDVGIVAGVGAMLFGIFFLAKRAMETAAQTAAGPGLALIVPLPSAEATTGFGYIGIPFWKFMITIVALIFIHEGFHAIQVRNEDVDIESMGIGLLAVLPLAFVEPDEEQFEEKSWRSRARVYAAGSFGNFLLGLAAVGILTYLMAPVFAMGAVTFDNYVGTSNLDREEPFPAQKAGLTGAIVEMDGKRIESVDDLRGIMSSKKPGDMLSVTTLNTTDWTTQSYKLRLAPHPEKPGEAFLGIHDVQDENILKKEYRENPRQASVINFFMDLLGWFFILNVGIGLVNLFPIRPLDGGLLFDALAQNFVPEYAEDIVHATAAFVLVLILWTFIGGVVL